MSSNRLLNLNYRLQRTKYVRIISGGLLLILPVLMIGSFALILRSFPNDRYIDFISSFGNGVFFNLFDIIHKVTFGCLGIYMTAALAYNYAKENNTTGSDVFGGIISALAVFLILTGIYDKNFSIDNIGPKAMITAIYCGYIMTALYGFLAKRIRKEGIVYSDGADERFIKTLKMILPIAIIIIGNAILAYSLSEIFEVSTLQHLIGKCVNEVFVHMRGNFGSGLLYVLLSSILWFFGIHGSDCLESVSVELFEPAMNANVAAVEAGAAPTEILTKQFFDIFVLMGGCGSAICLLIALLIFGKRRSDRRLAGIASFPMIFNINEVMVFGFPVILNPIMLIPFICTPIICYIVAYIALYTGIVDLTVASVTWTTPVIFGGYVATESVGGSILQIVNIIIGVAIYAPFVRINDKIKDSLAKSNYERLINYYKRNEDDGVELTLLDNEMGGTAKLLAVDLKEWVESKKISLYYQPQYNYNGKCIGVEALLRWKHKEFGMVFPPLVIELANETGCIARLEEEIFEKALSDLPEIRKRLGEDVKLSINITGRTLEHSGYVDFVRRTLKDNTGICLEITEQTALNKSDKANRVLRQIKDMGIQLAIDDFSMGQTSINYLKDKMFDLVKLDGSLVKDISNNPRCISIIESIASMANSMNFSLLAEYVETEEMREMLYKAGCPLYQGYLYSAAVPVEELGNN